MAIEFTPSVKKTKHNTFTKYVVIFISFLGSLFFVNTLTLGAIFYHIKQKISGEEQKIQPSEDSKAYENVKDLKISPDLRYYALKMNLDLETYDIVTDDGYVLVLHHLVDPKHSAEVRNSRRPILMQHGLLASSGTYLTSGLKSISYHMHEAGYDVWLGNNRCGFEARHKFEEGNLMHNEKYWDWDMRDLAYYDLPCIIDNVLKHKPHHNKLAYIGHSQGCTQAYLMLRNPAMKEYHEKLDVFFQLAPAIFPGRLFHERSFIKFLHHRSKLGFLFLLGSCSFLRNLLQARSLIGKTRFFGFVSYVLFKYLFGWSSVKWNSNKKIWHIHFYYNVTYVSTKLMSWWLSEWVPEGFSNQVLPKESYYTDDHYSVNSQDPILSDLGKRRYFPYKESWFNPETNRIVDMVIFPCGIDYLVDGSRLVTHMTNFEPQAYKLGKNLEIHPIDDYHHLDVVWADNARDKVGAPIVEKLNRLYASDSKSHVFETEKNTTRTVMENKIAEKIPLSFDEAPQLLPAIAA